MPIIGEYDILNKGYAINFKGQHDFLNLYKMMHDWLHTRGYVHFESNDINIEEYYYETLLPGGTHKNVWFWWRTVKKESEMFHYKLNITCQCLVLGSKEIMFQGRKIKVNDGEITFFFDGRLHVDPEDRMEKNWLSKMMLPIFNKKFYVRQVDEREADLQSQVDELFDKVKQFLGLMTVRKIERPFHPEFGYPQH